MDIGAKDWFWIGFSLLILFCTVLVGICFRVAFEISRSRHGK